jgi:hypothetical protein
LVVWNSVDSLSGTVWLDKSGNGNNGLVSGSTLALTGSLGYSFNGTDNYITYPINLVATPSSSWTMQYYGSIPSESVNRDMFVRQDYLNGWDLIYDGGNDPERLVFRDTPGGDRRMEITPTYASKQLITVTVNASSNVIQLYVNGTFIGNAIGSGDVNNFNAGIGTPFVFGWNADTDAGFWKGGVSDLILYNRILSAGEVTTNFNILN